MLVQVAGKMKRKPQPSAAMAAGGTCSHGGPGEGACPHSSMEWQWALSSRLWPPRSRGWGGSPQGLAAPTRPGCHVPVASLVWSITPVATLHLCSVLFK